MPLLQALDGNKQLQPFVQTDGVSAFLARVGQPVPMPRVLGMEMDKFSFKECYGLESLDRKPLH